MDMPNIATSDIRNVRHSLYKELPHNISIGLKKTVQVLFCDCRCGYHALSLNLFHLNTSFNYELSKVQKGFHRRTFILFQMA